MQSGETDMQHLQYRAVTGALREACTGELLKKEWFISKPGHGEEFSQTMPPLN